MASVQIVIALEEAFDIEIAEAEAIRTVSDIVLLVDAKILDKREAESGPA